MSGKPAARVTDPMACSLPGIPTAWRKVEVWSGGGWSTFDTMDREGLTSRVKHEASESFHIDLVQGGEA